MCAVYKCVHGMCLCRCKYLRVYAHICSCERGGIYVRIHMSVFGVCVTGRKCSRGLEPTHVWGGGLGWSSISCCSIGMYSLKKKAWS